MPYNLELESILCVMQHLFQPISLTEEAWIIDRFMTCLNEKKRLLEEGRLVVQLLALEVAHLACYDSSAEVVKQLVVPLLQERLQRFNKFASIDAQHPQSQSEVGVFSGLGVHPLTKMHSFRFVFDMLTFWCLLNDFYNRNSLTSASKTSYETTDMSGIDIFLRPALKVCFNSHAICQNTAGVCSS